MSVRSLALAVVVIVAVGLLWVYAALAVGSVGGGTTTIDAGGARTNAASWS